MEDDDGRDSVDDDDDDEEDDSNGIFLDAYMVTFKSFRLRVTSLVPIAGDKPPSVLKTLTL